jgi:N utilization substance protein B
MAARSKARHRALDVLFEADVRGRPALDVLADLAARRAAEGMPPLNPYTTELVEGVVGHQQDIDEQLATYAIGWTLDRMPSVDRNVLRIAAFELLFSAEVPGPVAVAEAVSLAREFSTDDSPRFVNGLLARLLELRGAS